jgi:hypothetical protein
MNSNMFEDTFMPGLWAGIPIFLLGVACFLQCKFTRPGLHAFIICYTLMVVANCVFFMAFKVKFILHDPEGMTFEDCEAPQWPSKFILDDPPHCNAHKVNSALGQSMLAFASADIIVCVVGLTLLCRTKYTYQTFRPLSTIVPSNVA